MKECASVCINCWMGVFTGIFEEVLIVDDQTASDVIVIHLVDVIPRICSVIAAGFGLRLHFLSLITD